MKDRKLWTLTECKIHCCTGDKCNTKEVFLPYGVYYFNGSKLQNNFSCILVYFFLVQFLYAQTYNRQHFRDHANIFIFRWSSVYLLLCSSLSSDSKSCLSLHFLSFICLFLVQRLSHCKCTLFLRSFSSSFLKSTG